MSLSWNSSTTSGTSDSRVCQNCGKRPGTEWWVGESGVVGWVHGMYVKWCELCVAKAQLAYARKRARAIPSLERKVAKLRKAGAWVATRPPIVP